VAEAHELCVLFLLARLDLAWMAVELGFAPTHVHLQDPGLAPIVQALLPTLSIVTMASLAWCLSLPCIAFVQGYAHMFSFLFESAELVLPTKVWKQQLDQPTPGWHLVKHTSASHALVGGVSDAFDFCFGWI
jgi:hypothetical protein